MGIKILSCVLCFKFQLSNGPSAPYINLLNVFAYGTYTDYKGKFTHVNYVVLKQNNTLTLLEICKFYHVSFDNCLCRQQK